MRRWLKRSVMVVGLAVVLAALNYAPVWASMFGEENVTLVNILAQTLHITNEMQHLNDTANDFADGMNDLVDTYQKMNAGYDELARYTSGDFLADFKDDFESQYPGLRKLEGASKRLRRWDQETKSSPWSAYQFLSAAAADVVDLTDDKAHAQHSQTRNDIQLLLDREADAAVAEADQAQRAAESMDEKARQFLDLLENPAYKKSPARSQELSARATVLTLESNSHLMRLLARGVRFDGIDRALGSGARRRSEAFERRKAQESVQFVHSVLEPPPLLTFELPW
jgi:hypothetical protein